MILVISIIVIMLLYIILRHIIETRIKRFYKNSSITVKNTIRTEGVYSVYNKYTTINNESVEIKISIFKTMNFKNENIEYIGKIICLESPVDNNRIFKDIPKILLNKLNSREEGVYYTKIYKDLEYVLYDLNCSIKYIKEKFELIQSPLS